MSVSTEVAEYGLKRQLSRLNILQIAINSIIAAGRADLCVLARAHLYDPYWTRHAAREQGVELPWPDQYVSVTGFTPRAT